MTLVDWVALAVIVGGLGFLLRRQLMKLYRPAAEWVRARPPLGLVLAIAVSVLAVVFLAWKVPQWQLGSRRMYLTAKEYLELQNSYRATVVQALGGLVVLVGIYFTWRRVAATEQQVVIAGEGQITERFTRAIEQLGSEKLEVKLGGIYALERIARDSEKDHWPIMEVLTAYVREKTPWSDPPPLAPPAVQLDIAAILTVLGRRRVEFESDIDWRLGLAGSDLREAQLIDAHLEEAYLWGAHLEGANLWRARLEEAELTEAYLTGAYLFQAHLKGADLSGADLTGANLSGADLSAADLAEVNLRGADLSGAKGLTREQIESAITDETTKLPDYLKEGGEGGRDTLL
jgi:hypothetical protein